MRNSIIGLVPVQESMVMGNRKRVPLIDQTREVFADVTSASQSEFYQSEQAGVNVELRATVWTSDFHDEKCVLHLGKLYSVVRTYMKRSTMETELYLERMEGIDAP